MGKIKQAVRWWASLSKQAISEAMSDGPHSRQDDGQVEVFPLGAVESLASSSGIKTTLPAAVEAATA